MWTEYDWRDPWVSIPDGFPRASILPELFDGRGCPEEARGSRMMGRNHRIPTIVTPRAH